MPRKTLNDICKSGATPGYILDEAKEYGTSEIDKLLDDAKGFISRIERKRETHLDKFYIGKSSVDEDKKNSTIWSSKSLVVNRFYDHKKKDYGRSGLIVLALTSSEKKALQLEKKLIENFRVEKNYKEKITNKTKKSGRISTQKHDKYCVYLAFGMRGKSIQWATKAVEQ